MSPALQYGLWIPAVVLQTAAAILMLRLKLHRSYAAFFAYTVFNVLRSATLYLILVLMNAKALPYATYFYTYWLLDVISIGLCFLVIYSAFQRVFQNYAWLRKFASTAFGVGVVVLLGVAVTITAMSPGTETQRIISAILLLDRSLMLIQAGLIVLLFLFAAVAALPWRTDFSFGIALGFGVIASIELAAATMRAEFGQAGNEIYQFACVAGYNLAVLIWLLYIRAPKKASEFSASAPDVTNVASWHETFTELLGR